MNVCNVLRNITLLVDGEFETLDIMFYSKEALIYGWPRYKYYNRDK